MRPAHAFPPDMPSPLPPLYALQAFLAAARHGSFTQAAEQMHLTQSAVSRQVQLLEDHFGCPLFVRHARGLALTAEGRELLGPVEEALDKLAKASATVRRSMTVLNLQLPPTMAVRWLLPRLPALQQALPELEVRVSTHWAEAPDFGRSDVDVIIAHGAGNWPHLHQRLLVHEHLAPMCAPALVHALREVADLGSVTLLHPGPTRREWSTWLAAAGHREPASQKHQVFDTLDICLQAAAQGLGVAIADPDMLAPALSAGTLAMPFAQRVPSGNAYYLTYPPQRQGQRKVELFERWIAAQFAAPAAQSSSLSA